MKTIAAALGIAMLGNGHPFASDVSGFVRDKLGKAVAGAAVCAQGSSAGCVQSGADGAFHFTGVTGTIPSEASRAGYALRRAGPALYLDAPSACVGRAEWYGSSGRRLRDNGASEAIALAAGPNLLRSPAGSEGLRILKVTTPAGSFTWTLVMGIVSKDPGGADPQSNRLVPHPKAAASPGVLEASKAGYRNAAYYLTADTETGALIVLPNSGDSVLFDGKTLKDWDFLAANWSTKDGNIVGNSSGNFGGTFIASKGVFRSFRLTVTERMVSGSHLGLCVWGKTTGPDNGGAGQCLVVIPPAGAMWDYGKGAIKGAGVGKAGVAATEWHQVELLARQKTGEILAACNGVQITYYKDGNPSRFPAGPVRLQLHANNGAQQMLYRDVIVEADPKDDKLLSLK
jgi:hypothetical protein